MPIEIRELIIRATINQDQALTTQQAPRPAGGAGLDDKAKEYLVEQCVEQVLTILRNQRER